MSGLSGDTGGNTGEFGAMLTLMANPAALQAKYAEFLKRQKAAEDAVALVGPAKDIQRLQAEAAKDRAAAADALAAAKGQAKTMLETAQQQAQATVQETQVKCNALNAASQKQVADADAAKKAADVILANARKVQQAADDRVADLNQKELALNKRAADVEIAASDNKAKAAYIKGVRDKIVAQLAEHVTNLKG